MTRRERASRFTSERANEIRRESLRRRGGPIGQEGILVLILEVGCVMVEVLRVSQSSSRFRLCMVTQVFMGHGVPVSHSFHRLVSKEGALSVEILATW